MTAENTAVGAPLCRHCGVGFRYAGYTHQTKTLLTLTVVGCFLRVVALLKGRETTHFSGKTPYLDEIGPCSWFNRLIEGIA